MEASRIFSFVGRLSGVSAVRPDAGITGTVSDQSGLVRRAAFPYLGASSSAD